MACHSNAVATKTYYGQLVIIEEQTVLIRFYRVLTWRKLFSLLMSKGLPSVVVRFILDGYITYIRQSACIQWEGVKSRTYLQHIQWR